MSPVDRSRLPAARPTPAFRFPEIKKARLANGLRLWTVEHRELPVLAVLLLVPAGSAVDPPDRPGLASLTADMADEGSGELSAIDIQDALARIGAEFETEVGPDAAVFRLLTLSRFGDRALQLLSDIIVRPRLAEEDFDRVRRLRLNRLVQLRDLPSAVAERAFAQVLYAGHPYGHLAVGTEAAVENASLDEVVRLHRTGYLPAHATLIIVGDATHDDLARVVERSFGDWWMGPPAADGLDAPGPAGVEIAPPFDPAARVTIVDRPGAAQSELRIGHVAAPRLTSDYHAILVLNMVLGGQFVSRVNLNLRERKGYTYGARTVFDFRRGPGPFVLQASVQTDGTADAIREALGEIEGIRGSRPVTPKELDVARAALTRGYPRNFETAEQMARAVSQLALYDLPDDYFEQFTPSVSAVEAPLVTEVARRHLHPQRLAAVIVGDAAAVRGAVGTLGLGEPALMSTTSA